MLVPTLGFEGTKISKNAGIKKPRTVGSSKIYFSQHSLNEIMPLTYDFSAGAVTARFSGNGQLCAMNTNNGQGFQICRYCGAAAGTTNNVKHTHYCESINPAPSYMHVDSLGTAFVSDVLELVLSIENLPFVDNYGWESVLWAVFTAAAKLLEIPQTELGGTVYENDFDTMSLLIYDDVPGGAGHTKQLSGMVDKLMREAYATVSHCSCSEDTCCYGCISNYNNQSRQPYLSRGAAARVLGALLGVN